MVEIEVITDPVAALTARHHDETAPRGRSHRQFVASCPAPSTEENQERRDARPS